jgi:hypothetical protein
MNYFNYFTEIETRFQQRRGSLLMLSTLDWALIETWREAGVPLQAVLRGIDAAFDNYDKQRLRSTRRQRKVNGLAWCHQAVMDVVEQSKEAAIGVTPTQPIETRDSGFEPARIARYLQHNAAALDAAATALPSPANTAATESAIRLRELAGPLLSFRSAAEESASPSNLELGTASLEDLDRTLTVLEEKLFAALLTAVAEEQLVDLREQATRELAPYRGKMQAVQIKQVQQQFLQKRLLEAHSLPRLSLFYMPHEDQV